MRIGIVSEGNSDQAVIKHILSAYLENPNLLMSDLMPLPKRTGNWNEVGKFISGPGFAQIFQDLDFVVLHLDSDVFRIGQVKRQWAEDFTHFDLLKTHDSIRRFLISKIDPAVFAQIENRILFSISINSIECWFVPVFLPENDPIDFVSADCIDLVKSEMLTKTRFSFNKRIKSERRYRQAAKELGDKASLENLARKHASLELFLKELRTKIVDLAPE